MKVSTSNDKCNYQLKLDQQQFTKTKNNEATIVYVKINNDRVQQQTSTVPYSLTIFTFIFRRRRANFVMNFFVYKKQIKDSASICF